MSPRNLNRLSPRFSEAGSPTNSGSASTSNCVSRNRWTILNFVGLSLNLSVLFFTLVVYHRMIDSVNGCHNNPNSLNDRREGDASNLPPVIRNSPVSSTSKPENTQPQIQGQNPTFIADDIPPPPRRDPDQDYHIIFSTGCSNSQHWQSYVLFHSVMESGQLGHVTRIASGCKPEQEQQLKHMHSTQIEPMGVREPNTPSRFHLHFTPDFGKSPHSENVFKYMNKPYGVAHWMEHVLGYNANNRRTSHDNTIIILLDPDMVIMRPIVNDFSEREVWRKRSSFPLVHQISHGYPMSQEYGFNDVWYRVVKDKQKLQDIIPPNELPSPVQNMTQKQIIENYTAGPPYMATARDFYKIVDKWRQLAWPVQKVFPDTILAEMFAYSWAAAHLNLPHQQAHSFMVSAHFEEGFHLFRRDKSITSDRMCLGNINQDYKPHILHYCQRYAVGKYVAGKYRLPDYFVGHPNATKSCEAPLLKEPPQNISLQYDYYIDPNDSKRYPMPGAKQGRFTQREHIDRIAFMMCELMGALNRAATYFKQQHCRGKGNLKKELIFHDTGIEVTPEEYNALGESARPW